MQRWLITVFTLFLFLPFPEDTAANGRGPASPCRIHHPSDEGVEWACVRLKRGETPERVFGDRWQDVLRFNRMDRRHAYPGAALKVPKNLEDVKDFTPMPPHFPDAEQEPRFILVDLREQFLGAYEFGKLVFSAPATTGEKGNDTPAGEFRITAFDRKHVSSLYAIEKTDIPYPMHYGLRFLLTRHGIAYWIHGRDVPGYPGSHGCIGLYDEDMQKKFYGFPRKPVLRDAKTLFEWVVPPEQDKGRLRLLKDGPRVKIIGTAPRPQTRPKK